MLSARQHSVQMHPDLVDSTAALSNMTAGIALRVSVLSRLQRKVCALLGLIEMPCPGTAGIFFFSNCCCTAVAALWVPLFVLRISPSSASVSSGLSLFGSDLPDPRCSHCGGYVRGVTLALDWL